MGIVIIGNPITLNVTIVSSIQGVTPSGAVVLKDGSDVLGTQYLVNGSTTFTLSSAALGLGTHEIVAYYVGDSNFAPSVSLVTTETIVNPTNTTSAITTSVTPSNYAQSVTFTCTISSSVTVNSGTVQFYDGNTAIGSPIAVVNDIAVLNYSSLLPGTHSIKAVYSGSNSINTSTSNTISQVVNKVTPTNSLSITPNPSYFNDGNVVVSTTLSGAPGTPTGSVVFFDGGTQIGSLVTLSSGSGSVSQSGFAGGTHSITMSYTGDSNYNPVNTSPSTMTVNAVPTSIVLGSNVNPATSGTVTFTATVSSTGGTPDGYLFFKDNGTSFYGSTLTSGVLSYTTSSLSDGVHPITAFYTGTTNYANSTSGTLPQTIGVGVSTTSVLSVDPGQTTLTCTITPNPGAGNGTVAFHDSNGIIAGYGAVAIDSSGVAVTSPPVVETGVGSYFAVYSGGTGFFSSTSNSVPYNFG